MFIAYAVLAGLLALAMTGSAVATFTRNPAVAGNMTKLGVPDSWLPWLGTAKVAGALGLLAGLVVPALGAAAAIGLVLYFVGALVTHVRAKDYALAPVLVLTVLPAVALVLRIASA
ncbi:DoxX family protein [Streptomyces sp. NPDC035033]|uniref:DoxX family protein n=1 Tax=Streptomyces sp. NPDC035033 TaxID=3155368 RepID=UPI0033DA4DE9